MIKLRIMRWENYHRSSGWVQCDHKCHYKREARGWEFRVDVQTEPRD